MYFLCCFLFFFKKQDLNTTQVGLKLLGILERLLPHLCYFQFSDEAN